MVTTKEEVNKYKSMVFRFSVLISHNWQEELVYQHQSIIGDTLITRKDGKQTLTLIMLYIRCMKSNLLNNVQQIEKNYKVLIKDKMIKVYDLSGRIIMKEPMSHKRTFKLNLMC